MGTLSAKMGFVVGIAAVSSVSAETELIGPLRIRDMTPFNILRLEMLPAQMCWWHLLPATRLESVLAFVPDYPTRPAAFMSRARSERLVRLQPLREC